MTTYAGCTLLNLLPDALLYHGTLATDRECASRVLGRRHPGRAADDGCIGAVGGAARRAVEGGAGRLGAPGHPLLPEGLQNGSELCWKHLYGKTSLSYPLDHISVTDLKRSPLDIRTSVLKLLIKPEPEVRLG